MSHQRYYSGGRNPQVILTGNTVDYIVDSK